MQYPAANAHPFEFARPILLLAALAFLAGFGGYLAIHPAPVSLARQAPQAAPAHAPATEVSTPAADPAADPADPADRPEKT
jgi:citrate lyase beta subunit